ncbi:MAG: (2Fe-2S) ferredoxin domain-containing protein [Planctomycetota bacterium]|nr:(2Fe-2S) ferredoxin domain-containing protein [Planctomycetota bacterium]MEC8652343.1 (2Fe-2S) ferredoxin domain-containing protein [Planctomycetota bacterium]
MSNRLCYVCEGGDCTEMGSGDLFDKLRDLVKEFDPNEERIKIRRYPCFGACEHGVNVTLYPDKVFYSTVKEEDLPSIAAHIKGEGESPEHLTGKAEPDVEQIIWDMLDSPY